MEHESEEGKKQKPEQVIVKEGKVVIANKQEPDHHKAKQELKPDRENAVLKGMEVNKQASTQGLDHHAAKQESKNAKIHWFC